MLTTVNCDNCGKEFSVSPSRLKVESLCCSKKCAADFKINSKKNNTECAHCKKAMYMKPYRLKRSKNVCCSFDCSQELRKTTCTGEKNHQYGIKGENNSSHLSDFCVSNYGYLRVLSHQHPCRAADNRLMFHRMVMEEHLKFIGDYENLVYKNGFMVLAENMVVHHVDENKLNNTIDNLQLMSLGEHVSHHNKEKYRQREIDELGRLLPGKIKSGKLYKKRSLDAGQDIFSDEDVVINPLDSKLVSTGLRIEIPDGHVGLIWSRSGMSVNHKIEVGAGCIDVGYSGEVKVHLYNLGETWYEISKGDKIAQLLTVPINLERYTEEQIEKGDRIAQGVLAVALQANFIEVESLSESERGSNGFGSSGT